MKYLFFTLVLLTACSQPKTADEFIREAQNYIANGEMNSAAIELKNALLEAPHNEAANLLLAEVLFAQKDYVSAEARARRIGESSDDAVHARALIAKSLVYQGKYAEVDAVETNGQAGDDQADILAAKGLAFLQRGQVEKAEILIESAIRAAPASAYVSMAQARLLMHTSDHEAAGELLSSLLEKNPDEAEAWVLYGLVENTRGQKESSIEAFTTALELAPSYTEPRFYRANTLLDLGRSEQALEDISVLKKRDKTNPGASYLEGLYQFQNKEYALAAASFDSALRAEDRFPLALLLGAISNYMQGNTERAEDLVIRFRMKDATNIPARKLLASIHVERDQPEKAIALLDPVYTSPNKDVGTVNILARAYAKVGNNDEVMELLEESVKLDPTSTSTRTRLAAGYFNEGQLDLAESQLETAISQDPLYHQADTIKVLGYFDAGQKDKAFAALAEYGERNPGPGPKNLEGVLHARLNDVAKAEQAFKSALEISPGDPFASNMLAKLALLRGDKDAARSHYETVLQHYPGNREVAARIIEIKWTSGEREQAISDLEGLIQTNPDVLNLRTMLASYYLVSGRPQAIPALFQTPTGKWDRNPVALYLNARSQIARMEYEKAIATLKKLLEKEPDSAPAYAALARALAAKGDIARSREALNKALSLEPGNLQTRLAAARFSFFARDMPALQQELAAIPANFQELPDVLYIKGLSARLSGDDGAALDYFERTFEQIQTPETMAAVAQQRWQMDRKQASLAFQKEWLSAHPDDSDSRLRLAHYLKRQGENELALDQYALVLEHDGTNTAALNSSAWMLRDSDPAKGLGLIERALKVDATNPALLDTKGVLLLKNAQFKEAELQFNKALLAQPDEPNVLYHLAMLKVAENDTDEAERILEKVLSNAMPFAERDAATALLLSVQGKQSK